MAKNHDLGLAREPAAPADQELQHCAEGEKGPKGHHHIVTQAQPGALQSQIRVLAPFTAQSRPRPPTTGPATPARNGPNRTSSSADSSTSTTEPLSDSNPNIETLHPVRTPVANAYAERFVRTIRRECLDWILIRSERHLAYVSREYLEHYNRERPHRGLGLRPPDPPPRLVAGPIERRDRLGGLIHHYERTAA
jgi:transposase InsO family protein